MTRPAAHHQVKRVRRTLTKLRNAKDTRGLMDALAVCIRSNFAGTESVKMYSEVSNVLHPVSHS